MSTPAYKIVDAVTAVLVHDGDIYLTRRQPWLPTFSGYDVFPGGKVDRTDSDEPYAAPALAAQNPRLMRALVRELQEELAFDLAAAAEQGEVESVVELGVALTPPSISPVRFNTHFYRVDLKRKPGIVLDLNEAITGSWATPAAWMALYEQGELMTAPPTLITLRALAADAGVQAVPGLLRPFDPDRIPLVEHLRGLRQLLVPSHTLPPADTTNCFLVGDGGARRVLVDPSPKSLEVLERMCQTLDELGIDEVFITHHHPDHRERANELARRYGVPIGLSADTHARISGINKGRYSGGADWFDGIEVKFYREGDIVTRWLGHDVQVLEVPGHDAGQLALMPDNRAWCIVGDLIQGIGTVVIAKPEGNMRVYFETLRKVIALAPRAIFPSHGQGLGTVYRLEETLRHREQRETQVLTLHREGQTMDQMLGMIYKDVDPRLLPLARMNIESHLDKLREEGVVA